MELNNKNILKFCNPVSGSASLGFTTDWTTYTRYISLTHFALGRAPIFQDPMGPQYYLSSQKLKVFGYALSQKYNIY